jgi:pyridine nucleotide-disulfide oxidoreductase family protein
VPLGGVRLTLVDKELAAQYSGMLPGFVAGHYDREECHINLERLTQFAGATLIHDAAVGIDLTRKRVLVGGDQLRYDLLSIDVGITPHIDDIEGAREHAIAVKPISNFAAKWQALQDQAMQPAGPRSIVVVGGGAAGVELVLAARHGLLSRAPAAGIDPHAFSFSLITGDILLPTHNALARTLARKPLLAAGVELFENDFATAITSTAVKLRSGQSIAADAVLISTKAAAPRWLAKTGLALDGEGFVATRPTLQVLHDDDVFAVGDCASVLAHPREKSGVFAVRQGPVVAENLRRRALGSQARSFIPQKNFLTLISLGEKRAIAARGPFAAAGHWAWRWKDYIDRSFVNSFNKLSDAQ